MIGQGHADQHQTHRDDGRTQHDQGLVDDRVQAPAGGVPQQAGHHRQHDGVDHGVANGQRQRAAQVLDVCTGATARLGAANARQVQFSQRRQHRQQHDGMQTDQGDVDAQPGFAEQRRRQWNAHLHRIAEGRTHGAHRRCRCAISLATRAPALPGIGAQQDQQHGHEEGPHGGPGQGGEVQPHRCAEQQGRHEDVERGMSQHPRRVLLFGARLAHAAGGPAQGDGQKDRQQLVEDGDGHGGETDE